MSAKEVLKSIDENNNLKIELTELQNSLEEGGILFDIDTNTNKQKRLKEELNGDKITQNFLAEQIKIINGKGKLEPREQKLKSFGNKYFGLENAEVLNQNGNSTREIIKGTELEKKLTEFCKTEIEAKKFSDKIDQTWYKFIETSLDSSLPPEKMKKLSIGVSFAFMDWLNNVQNSKDSTKKVQIGGFFDKITKYSNSIASLSGGGMDMLGGLVGGLGQYAAELPLDNFFKKIQNSINIIKKNSKSDNFQTILEPGRFVSFFQKVPDSSFLNIKEIPNNYFENEKINKQNLKKIAKKNGEKFDHKTFNLLKDVIKKSGPVLELRNTGRKAVLGLYDQISNVVSQIGEIAKILGFDFGSVKDFLKGLGPIGDMAFAILGFNGVDGFVQEYWLDKLGGGLDETQQNFVDYSVSYYRENLQNSEPKYLKEDGDPANKKDEIDYIGSLGQESSFYSMIGGKFEQKTVDGKKVMLPNIPLSTEIKGEEKTIYQKIPLSFGLVKKSIQKSWEENYPDKSFDDSNFEKEIAEISQKILTDKDFMYEFASNDDLNEADFVSALTGSYILYKKTEEKTSNPHFLDYAKAVGVGAVGYNYIKVKKTDENPVENEEQSEENPVDNEESIDENGNELEYQDYDVNGNELSSKLIFKDGVDHNSKKVKFIKNLYPVCLKASRELNISIKAIMSQIAFESGWGNSELAKIFNNFGGIKFTGGLNINQKGTSFEQDKSTLEKSGYEISEKQGYKIAKKNGKIVAVHMLTKEDFKDGEGLVEVKQWFRVFNNPGTFFRKHGYINTIKNSNYQNQLNKLTEKERQNPKKVITAIHDGGYAALERNEYIKHTMNMVKTLEKHIDFDKMQETSIEKLSKLDEIAGIGDSIGIQMNKFMKNMYIKLDDKGKKWNGGKSSDKLYKQCFTKKDGKIEIDEHLKGKDIKQFLIFAGFNDGLSDNSYDAKKSKENIKKMAKHILDNHNPMRVTLSKLYHINKNEKDDLFSVKSFNSGVDKFNAQIDILYKELQNEYPGRVDLIKFEDRKQLHTGDNKIESTIKTKYGIS